MKKRHQHFIPRTYLKHFKNSPEYKQVNTFDKVKNKFVDNVGINAICVEKDFYTLKNLNGEDKLALEEFFDKEIESKYGKVYDLLVYKKPDLITLEEKVDILKSTLSMYFRTPKVLNQLLLKFDSLIEDLIYNKNVNEIEFKGVIIKIDGKTKDEIKKEIKEHIRVDYLAIQLNFFEEFVKYKMYDGITVIENTSEFDFYTGDNPVNFLNGFGSTEEIFDVDNSIYIPLNTKFCLFIAPPKLPKSGYEVFYQKDNQMLIHVVNLCTFENSERWIIGEGDNFKKALKKTIEINSNNDGEHPQLKSMEIKVNLLSKLLTAMEGGLTNENQHLLKAVNDIKDWNEHQNHDDLMELLENLRTENGIKI